MTLIIILTVVNAVFTTLGIWFASKASTCAYNAESQARRAKFSEDAASASERALYGAKRYANG